MWYPSYSKSLPYFYNLNNSNWANKCMCTQQRQISLVIPPVWSESLLCTQWVAKDPSFMRTEKTLIRLGSPGWPESSLGTHAILLVLSCAGSIDNPLMCLLLWWNGKHCRPRDKWQTMQTPESAVWSGVTLFAQALLSRYSVWIRYPMFP